jgi:hypothetical protein
MGHITTVSAATSVWNKLTPGHGEASFAQAPEDIAVKKPLLQVDTAHHPSSSSGSSSYGATSLSSSPERIRGDASLLMVPEERPTDFNDDDVDLSEEEEWELEQHGLYKGQPL